MIEKHIIDFLNEIKNGDYQITSHKILRDVLPIKTKRIYNEESLRIELGNYLANKLPNYRVEYERNVMLFGIAKKATIKSEIDIVVFDKNIKEKYAIELKFPRNGNKGTTQGLKEFERDEEFIKELVKNYSFNSAYSLVLTDDKDYYDHQKQIGKNVKSSNQSLYAKYRTQGYWKNLQGNTKYALRCER